MKVGSGLLFYAWFTLVMNVLMSMKPFCSGISLEVNNRSISSLVKAMDSCFMAFVKVALSSLWVFPNYSYLDISTLISIPWCLRVVANLLSMVSTLDSTASSCSFSKKN